MYARPDARQAARLRVNKDWRIVVRVVIYVAIVMLAIGLPDLLGMPLWAGLVAAVIVTPIAFFLVGLGTERDSGS